MAEDAEERTALAGVCSDANNSGGVGGEELVEYDFGAVVLRGVCFGGDSVPDLVVPGEASAEVVLQHIGHYSLAKKRVDDVVGERLGDVRPV